MFFHNYPSFTGAKCRLREVGRNARGDGKLKANDSCSWHELDRVQDLRLGIHLETAESEGDAASDRISTIGWDLNRHGPVRFWDWQAVRLLPIRSRRIESDIVAASALNSSIVCFSTSPAPRGLSFNEL